MLSYTSSFVSVLIAATFFLKLSVAFTQCYYPDGSIPTDFLWEPCKGAEVSSCCIPSEGDICQENGLCFYPLKGDTFRGTCTDRSWNSTACSQDICVTGYEADWVWAVECDANGSSSFACGGIEDGQHKTATCSENAIPNTAYFRTTTTTSSASRYVAPSPIDTALYSVYTETYTTIITANVQTTTRTSTFQSTKTSIIAQLSSTSANKSGLGNSNSTASNDVSPTASNGVSPTANKVTLATGLLVVIIVAPILVIALALLIFFYFRKRSKNAKAINIPDHPPPNGPVGADQSFPYEVDNNEATAVHPQPQMYTYSTLVEQIPDSASPYGNNKEKLGQSVEMGDFHGSLSPGPKSPAPAYTQNLMVVELDGHSSMKGGD